RRAAHRLLRPVGVTAAQLRETANVGDRVVEDFALLGAHRLGLRGRGSLFAGTLGVISLAGRTGLTGLAGFGGLAALTGLTCRTGLLGLPALLGFPGLRRIFRRGRRLGAADGHRCGGPEIG